MKKIEMNLKFEDGAMRLTRTYNQSTMLLSGEGEVKFARDLKVGDQILLCVKESFLRCTIQQIK